MVFLIQQSQNKDSVAVHLKLNELLASHNDASNRLIGIEDATETDLRRIADAYLALAEKAGNRSKDRPRVEERVKDAKQATPNAQGGVEGNRDSEPM